MTSEWFGILPEFFRHPYVKLFIPGFFATVIGTLTYTLLFGGREDESGTGGDSQNLEQDDGGSGPTVQVQGDDNQIGIGSSAQNTGDGSSTEEGETSSDGGSASPIDCIPHHLENSGTDREAYGRDEIRIFDELGKFDLVIDGPVDWSSEWVYLDAGNGIEFDFVQIDAGIEDCNEESKFRVEERATNAGLRVIIHQDQPITNRELALILESTEEEIETYTLLEY